MNFRQWVQEKWYEHVEEVRTWEGVEPTLANINIGFDVSIAINKESKWD